MSLSHDSADRLDVPGAGDARSADPTDPRIRKFRAPTIEAALSAARAELGPDVEVVAANRIRRGGVGGFFATDLGVELMVLPPAGDDAAAGARSAGLLGDGGFHDDRLPERRLFPAATGRPSIAPVPDGAPGVLDRLLESVTRAELIANGHEPAGPASFADHLAHHLAAGGSHRGPLPVDPTPPSADRSGDDAPVGPAGPDPSDPTLTIERPVPRPADAEPDGDDVRVRAQSRDPGHPTEDRPARDRPEEDDAAAAIESSQRLARLRRAAERCRDAGALGDADPAAPAPSRRHDPERGYDAVREPIVELAAEHENELENELDDELDDGPGMRELDDDPRLPQLDAELHALHAARGRVPSVEQPLPVRRHASKQGADPMDLAAGAIGRLVESSPRSRHAPAAGWER